MIVVKERIPESEGKRVVSGHEELRLYAPPAKIYIQEDGSLLCFYSDDPNIPQD